MSCPDTGCWIQDTVLIKLNTLYSESCYIGCRIQDAALVKLKILYFEGYKTKMQYTRHSLKSKP